jgi:hypothetical protein
LVWHWNWSLERDLPQKRYLIQHRAVVATDHRDLCVEICRIKENPPRPTLEGYPALVCLWPTLLYNLAYLGETLMCGPDDGVDAIKLYGFSLQDIQIFLAQPDKVLKVSLAGADKLKAPADFVIDVTTLDGEGD